MLAGKKLADLTENDFLALITNAVREERQLDFKSTLPGPKDSDKKAFLADVAAFANSAGGDIIFGLEEHRDAANIPTGVAKAIVGVAANIDAEVRRLTSVIESGLDPQVVPKVQFQEVTTSQGSVVVLRVAKSWAAPHMVKDGWKFYARQGPQNLPMDAGTLRAAFSASEGWPDKLRRFRDERVGRIVGEQLAAPLLGPERIVLHLVPFSASSPAATVDLLAIKKARPVAMMAAMSTWWRFNADGVLTGNGGGGGAPCAAYTQFFRNGAVEAVAYAGSLTAPNTVWPFGIEDDVLGGANDYRRILGEAGVTFPLAVLLTLVSLNGREVRTGSSTMFRHIGEFDREVVFLPDVLIPDVEADLKQALRPIFDSLWQACGRDGSPSYATDGSWARKQ